MRLRRPSRTTAVSRAAAATIEALEGRQYFVTLTGNSEFIFHDPEVDLNVPRQIQVNTTGNIVVELVGASPNQFGGIDLVEIPGSLNGTSLLGGVGGLGGVDLLEASGADGIDVVDPDDVLPGFGGLAFDVAGNDDINFRALASTEAGVMYGINVFDFSTGTGTSVDRRALLVRFDDVTGDLDATVVADLTDSILTPPVGAANAFANDVAADPDVPATVNGVTAAAFDPSAGAGNSILYFVAAGGVGNRPQLFSVDVSAANPAAIAASVTGFTGTFGSTNVFNDDNVLVPNFNNVVVNSIAFDQLTPTTSRLLAAVTRDVRRVTAGGQSFATDRVADLRVSTTPGGLGNAVPGREITFQGDSVVNITGLDFAADNEAAQDNIVFFITSETTTEDELLNQGGANGGGDGGTDGDAGVTLDPFILQADLSQGGGGELPLLVIGSLPDATDTIDPIRGTDLQGLTWVDDGPGGVVDPITGAEAAFVAVDATSDELVVISASRRAPDADLFHIRIVSADEDATLSVVSTEVINNVLQILPFTGAPQPFKAVPTQPPPGLISVVGDAGIGRVWIGGRTLLNPLSQLPVPGFLPWIQAPQTQPFGTLPPVPSLTAGISSAPGIEMGKILIGGALTGKVSIDGSIDTFYAGWLLTGSVGGTAGGDPGVVDLPQEGGGNSAADDTLDTTNNFLITGDARVIISRGSVGTNTISQGQRNYSTQFDAEIGGELGHFQSHNSMEAGVQVGNAAGVGFDAENNTEEYETRFNLSGTPTPSGQNFIRGLLGSADGDAAFLLNDTLDNPQFLNAIGEDNVNGFVRVDGLYEGDPISLQPEPADTYAVPLMAGQTYIFQSSIGALSIYDPDGNRVASDSSHFGTNAGLPFRFTTDKPGIYLMQIAIAQSPWLSTPYVLTVRGAGNLALGGVVAANEIYGERTSGEQNEAGGLITPNDPLDFTSFLVRNGDLGAIAAGTVASFSGDYLFRRTRFDYSGRDDVRADNGNVRTFDAGQVGLAVNLNGFGVNVEATQGDIGLLRSRTGIMNIETANVGGSLQLGDAATTGYIQLNAKVGMSVFRAGDMASLQPSIFRVNSDESGADGRIGLIDSQGDFGILTGTSPVSNIIIENFVVAPPDADVNPVIPGGGPQIFTGQGGDVRYINVEGQVFQDIFFGANGAGELGEVSYQPNESPQFRDDGGGTVTISAMGQFTPNPLFRDPDAPNFDPTDPTYDPTQTEFLGPNVSATSYGIRSGGVVLIRVAGDGGVGLEGIRVVGNSQQAVDIARVALVNVDLGVLGPTPLIDAAPVTLGTPLIIGTNGLPLLPGGNVGQRRGPLTLGPDGLPVEFNSIGNVVTPLEIMIGGTGTVNVLRAEGRNSSGTYGGYFTAIRNSTDGELANVQAFSVADLFSHGPLGYARPMNGVGVNGKQTITQFVPEYPGTNKYNGVLVGDIARARSDSMIGNIIAIGDLRSALAAQGNIGLVRANADGIDEPDDYEGVVGTIYANRDPILSGNVSGTIYSVTVGEGLAPTGSGSVPNGGIFADGVITQVSNDGRGSDIYGDIVSSTRIRTVTLANGSIINSDISVNTDFELASIDPAGGGELPTTGNPVTRRFIELETISVRGEGGIIGSQISAGNIGVVDVSRGFGIFTSEIDSLGTGFVNSVEGDGYGIRFVSVNAGSTLNRLVADGDGRNISTATFSPTVRFSETQPVDPYFSFSFHPISGQITSIINDLHAVLGTSASVPVINGVTDSGVIENVDARGSGDLGLASAYQMRTRQVAVVPVAGIQFANQFSFGNRIRTLRTLDRIDGLGVTTGRLQTFAPGSDVFRFTATLSSAGNIRINGSLGGDSTINAIGTSGSINSINVRDDLDGIVRASTRIGSVYVGGVTTGQILIDNFTGGTNINKLTAAGGIGNENLVINGSIGRVIVGSGSALLTPGGTLTVNGNLAGVSINGGVLDTNLVVNGNIGTINVRGTIIGDITATGDVRTIAVSNAEGANTDSVRGDINVAGNLGSFTIAGGNLIGNVTVDGTLRKFSQTNGSVVAATGTTVPPTFSIGQALESFSTTGNVVANLRGDFFGNVSIRGDYGDGTTPLTSIATGDWGVLSVLGTIRSGASTNIAGTLGSLVVGGNVEAGAVVAAGAIGKKSINGTVAGTVTP